MIDICWCCGTKGALNFGLSKNCWKIVVLLENCYPNLWLKTSILAKF